MLLSCIDDCWPLVLDLRLFGYTVYVVHHGLSFFFYGLPVLTFLGLCIFLDLLVVIPTMKSKKVVVIRCRIIVTVTCFNGVLDCDSLLCYPSAHLFSCLVLFLWLILGSVSSCFQLLFFFLLTTYSCSVCFLVFSSLFSYIHLSQFYLFLFGEWICDSPTYIMWYLSL